MLGMIFFVFWRSFKLQTCCSTEVIIIIFALPPFILIFTHLWRNDYMTYPLEGFEIYQFIQSVCAQGCKSSGLKPRAVTVRPSPPENRGLTGPAQFVKPEFYNSVCTYELFLDNFQSRT